MNLQELTTYYVIYDSGIMKHLKAGNIKALLFEWYQTDNVTEAKHYSTANDAITRAKRMYLEFNKALHSTEAYVNKAAKERPLPELSVRELNVSTVGNVKVPIPVKAIQSGFIVEVKWKNTNSQAYHPSENIRTSYLKNINDMLRHQPYDKMKAHIYKLESNAQTAARKWTALMKEVGNSYTKEDLEIQSVRVIPIKLG